MSGRRKNPAIMVIGAHQSVRGLHAKHKKQLLISRKKKGNTIVFFLENNGVEFRNNEWSIVKRSITRCSLILLLQDAAVGVALQAAAIAKTHNVNVIIDPEPMLTLMEKIRRAAEQIKYVDRKKHTAAKKWRKRHI
ncbi:hypothetical protein NIE88_14370 [Sporolactobacillus shoreicorticis]|uniref:Uncharacterized protein n=1 Tax=Sporolactobacillus shoreicorticis TaxID=1923877 RepID=A0ABW5S9C6_9BACL|nr:hypothetical protein [Sporolactobacillus shoreicorticis]MCO7126953.1 hypothetical protein [Sporolactobacillus shoreicorticis]